VAHLYFFQRTDQRKKNPKEPPSQRTKTAANNGQQSNDRQERQPITAPTRNWRFSASYDSFVVNQTLVLRMNICGENRQLLVAAKRYLNTDIPPSTPIT
jgi:hypothetical protein